MEIDEEKYKQFVLFLLEQVEKADAAIFAYRTVLHTIALQDPKYTLEVIEEAVALAVKSDPIRQEMEKKYKPLRERFLEIVSGSSDDQDLLRWLRDWKPEGPVN